uniref:PID domain-containing protein n=1 Tax=Haemonchus contortus TaxID=6289 RepID=A0A7I4Y9X2_HAECO
MVQKLENEPTSDDQPKNPPSPKSRLAVLKRNKKPNAASDPFRFQGNGVTYKGKLIGERDVDSARGDAMCADAMRAAKAAVKAAGAHKTRIILQINIDGIKIVDEKSNAVLHNFPVSRVSFIARDTTDARAFGIVFGQPDNKYKFYGIKTAQTADQAVLAIRDMFQVVFEMKKKHIEQVKQKQEENKETTPEDGVAVADLLDLETEVQQIEQGLHQLEQIPTNTDAFGATPFADPFQDNSFASSVSMNGSYATAALNGVAHNPPQFQAPFNPQPQAAAWPQAPVVPPMVAHPPFQLPVPQAAAPFTADAWGAPQLQHTHSTPSFAPAGGFSETNPFAGAVTAPQQFVPPRDPFDTRNIMQLQPTLHNAAATRNVDWGTKENAAPPLHHANSFTTNNCFGDNNAQNQNKWEERKVTSLEDAFTKLVDMNALVSRPANDTKKNPFEHILNPPKASLNALGAVPMRPAPVVMANHADPFGDDFFR